MPVFQDIITKGIQAGYTPARTKVARDWYREAASDVVSISNYTLARQFKEKRKLSRPVAGYMYLFKYDPKTKEDLPYYDNYPLVFPIEPRLDGFIGINFHYLPHMLRAKLMNAIYTTTTDRKYNEETKVQLSYNLMKGVSKYKAFKPTIKRYLYSNVRSPFLQITASEWDIALFLPLERFKKSAKEDVWSDSESMI